MFRKELFPERDRVSRILVSDRYYTGFPQVPPSMGTSDSVASTEIVNDARVAVRLISSDGDVLWAATKESHGAKFKGASADVADQVVKQLLRDLDRLQSQPEEREAPK